MKKIQKTMRTWTKPIGGKSRELDKTILFLFNSAAMKIGAEFHQQKSLREEAKWASLSVQILSSLKMWPTTKSIFLLTLNSITKVWLEKVCTTRMKLLSSQRFL